MTQIFCFNCDAICPTKNILVSNVFAQEKGVLLNVWSRANVTSFFVCRHLGIWNSWLTMDECTNAHYIFNKKHIFKIIGSDSTILIMKMWVIKSLYIWVLNANEYLRSMKNYSNLPTYLVQFNKWDNCLRPISFN